MNREAVNAVVEELKLWMCTQNDPAMEAVTWRLPRAKAAVATEAVRMLGLEVAKVTRMQLDVGPSARGARLTLVCYPPLRDCAAVVALTALTFDAQLRAGQLIAGASGRVLLREAGGIRGTNLADVLTGPRSDAARWALHGEAVRVLADGEFGSQVHVDGTAELLATLLTDTTPVPVALADATGEPLVLRMVVALVASPELVDVARGLERDRQPQARTAARTPRGADRALI